MQDLDWNDLRLLATLARHPSLAAAAEELGVDPSTVWRRLKRLEEGLGVRLFERGRRYAPTEEGERLVARALRVEQEVHRFARAVGGPRDADVEGLVRLTLPHTFVPRVSGVLDGLLESHPRLRIELDTSPVARDLDRNEAHIALRTAKSPPVNAVATLLGEVGWAVHARPDAPDRWIDYGAERQNVPAVARHRAAGSPEGALVADTVAAMQDLLLAGLGRGLLPTYLGDDLVTIGKPDPRDSTNLWVLYHPDHRRVRRVRVVVEALLADPPVARL